MKKTLLLLAIFVFLGNRMQAQHMFGSGFIELSTVTVDSVHVIYRGYDSLAIERSWSAPGFVVVTLMCTNTSTLQSVSLPPLVTSGQGTDTVGIPNLMAGANYEIVVRVTDGSLLDSLVVIDSTLSNPPSPVQIGPAISVLNTTSYSSLLAVPYERNSGGMVFITWEDSIPGGAWSFLTTHQIAGTNATGDDTLTVFQNPATTVWYRALGINQLFPLNQDTTLTVSVTTLPVLSNPPIVDSIIVSNVTTTGGVVTITLTADSIGGILFVETTCGGMTQTYAPIAYTAGTNSYQIAVTTCGALDSVIVSVEVISSNINWSSVFSGTWFQTASGPFEISLLNCFSTGSVATVDVEYSSGGYANNSMYLFAFNSWDINFTNAIAYSQIYSGIPEAQNGSYTMSITSGLMPSTTYLLKAYMFNSLGQIETPSSCTVTMPGVTSLNENHMKDVQLFFDSEHLMLRYSSTKTEMLEIYDIHGSVIQKVQVYGDGEIMCRCAPGVYVAQFGEVRLKVVIQ